MLVELFRRADAGMTVIPETGSLIWAFATPISCFLLVFADVALSFLVGENDLGFMAAWDWLGAIRVLRRGYYF